MANNTENIVGGEILGAHNSGSETGSLISRFEIARNDILDEFIKITTDNGYRNDVADVIKAIRPLDRITEFPEIGVQLGNRIIKLESTNWTSSEAFCDVYVQGAVTADGNMDKDPTLIIDAVESISHDMLRVMSVLFTKYVNPRAVGADFRWNINPSSPIKITPPFFFGDKVVKAWVVMEFQIQMKAINGTFA